MTSVINMPDVFAALRPGELWVFTVEVHPQNANSLYHLLSVEEKARSEKYRRSQDSAAFIVSKGSRRSLLSAIVNQSTDAVAFVSGAYGKPELAGSKHSVRFNSSHSGDLVVHAISCDQEVGVDIEFIRCEFPVHAVAGRFFNAAEIAHLRMLPADVQTRAFYRYWTCKEAVLKCTGCGLSQGLESVDVTLEAGVGMQARSLTGGPCPCVQELALGDNYSAAVAFEQPGTNVHCCAWRIS